MIETVCAIQDHSESGSTHLARLLLWSHLRTAVLDHAKAGADATNGALHHLQQSARFFAARATAIAAAATASSLLLLRRLPLPLTRSRQEAAGR